MPETLVAEAQPVVSHAKLLAWRSDLRRALVVGGIAALLIIPATLAPMFGLPFIVPAAIFGLAVGLLAALAFVGERAAAWRRRTIGRDAGFAGAVFAGAGLLAVPLYVEMLHAFHSLLSITNGEIGLRAFFGYQEVIWEKLARAPFFAAELALPLGAFAFARLRGWGLVKQIGLLLLTAIGFAVVAYDTESLENYVPILDGLVGMFVLAFVLPLASRLADRLDRRAEARLRPAAGEG